MACLITHVRTHTQRGMGGRRRRQRRLQGGYTPNLIVYCCRERSMSATTSSRYFWFIQYSRLSWDVMFHVRIERKSILAGQST